MCCCDKPTINGQPGYKWNNPNAAPGIYPVNPPDLAEGETVRFDEPGRCGGQDSHSYHYRVTTYGELLVRHGAGDERIRLSNGKQVVTALASLDSDARYWILNAIYHAQSHAASDARHREHSQWTHAVAQKRVKTRKQRGTVRVWIEPEVK